MPDLLRLQVLDFVDKFASAAEKGISVATGDAAAAVKVEERGNVESEGTEASEV